MFSAAQEHVSQAASPVGGPLRTSYSFAGPASSGLATIPCSHGQMPLAILALLSAGPFFSCLVPSPLFYRFHQSSAFAFS